MPAPKTQPPPAIPEPRASETRAKSLELGVRRPVVATRYPNVYRGELLAARVLAETLMRFGVPRSELADDLGVSPNIVADWCSGQRAMPFGAVLAIRNRRLRETLLRDGEHAAATASNDNSVRHD
jgi:hypothetical protein